jgi:hypothetical protein
MSPRAVTARDAGLRLIARINRWMIAGAVALSGLISVAAARSFHGRTATPTGAATSQPSSSSSSSGSSSSSDGSGIQPPPQAPASAPAQPAPAPVVSGGS